MHRFNKASDLLGDVMSVRCNAPSTRAQPAQQAAAPCQALCFP